MKTERRISFVFGAVLVCFLIVAFFVVPKESQTHPIVRLLAAVFTGAVAYFISGDIYIEVKGQLASKTKYTIQATAGAALFVLVFVFWNKLISSSEGEVAPHQTATTTGSNSTINQAGRDLTINNGTINKAGRDLTIHNGQDDETRADLRRVWKEDLINFHDRLDKQFPDGYVTFGLDLKGRVIIQLTENVDTNVVVSWNGAKIVSITDDMLHCIGPNIEIKKMILLNGATVLGAHIDDNGFSIQRRRGAVTKVPYMYYNVIVEMLDSNPEDLLLVMGLEKAKPEIIIRKDGGTNVRYNL